MKIYRNPYMSKTNYFVKTGKARTGKAEASASKGYSVELIDGKWEVREAFYYDCTLRDLPVVAESKTSIQSVIEQAILTAILDLVQMEAIK